MALLLVDNGSTLFAALLRVLPQDTVTCTWKEAKKYPFNKYQGVILSGGSLFSVEENKEKLKDEMMQIRECERPILGICFGLEVLVAAYGGTLARMQEDHQGDTHVHVQNPDFLFGNHEKFSVYEHHQWRIETLPDAFTPLAHSTHALEVVRHEHLPHYGLQFHPEHVAEDHVGKEMLNRFVALTLV